MSKRDRRRLMGSRLLAHGSTPALISRGGGAAWGGIAIMKSARLVGGLMALENMPP